jgi:hypothetical protein
MARFTRLSEGVVSPEMTIEGKRVTWPYGYDRRVGAIETIGERGYDRRMMHERRCHTNVFIVHNQTAVAQLVDMNQWNQRNPTVILDPSVDVVGVHFEEQLRHLRKRRWSPGIDARAEPRGPRQPNQIPLVRIVVGVLMGQEDVT